MDIHHVLQVLPFAIWALIYTQGATAPSLTGQSFQGSMKSQRAVAVPPKGVAWLPSQWERKSVQHGRNNLPKRGNAGKRKSRAVAPLIEKIVPGKNTGKVLSSVPFCSQEDAEVCLTIFFLFSSTWVMPHDIPHCSFTISIISPPKC